GRCLSPWRRLGRTRAELYFDRSSTWLVSSLPVWIRAADVNPAMLQSFTWMSGEFDLNQAGSSRARLSRSLPPLRTQCHPARTYVALCPLGDHWPGDLLLDTSGLSSPVGIPDGPQGSPLASAEASQPGNTAASAVRAMRIARA